MLIDKVQVAEGSQIVNAVIDGDTSFPSNPDTGELFYRSDTNDLYLYTGSWTMLATSSITFPITGDSGDKDNPTYSFSSSSDSGMYLTPGLVLAFSSGGVASLQIETDGTLNVSAITDYEDQVTDDDDIPNKRYVDEAVSGHDPAGADTQVQYNDSGSFGASANFTWDDTTGTLNISRESDTGSGLTASYSNTPGNSGAWKGFRARGTRTSPSDVQSGDIIAKMLGSGRAGGSSFNAAGIEMTVDSGTISGSSLPTYISFLTTPDGSTTRSEKLRIDKDGIATFSTGGSPAAFAAFDPTADGASVGEKWQSSMTVKGFRFGPNTSGSHIIEGTDDYGAINWGSGGGGADREFGLSIVTTGGDTGGLHIFAGDSNCDELAIACVNRWGRSTFEVIAATGQISVAKGIEGSPAPDCVSTDWGIDVNDRKIINVDTPTDGTDVTNKDYVDDRKNYLINANFDVWQRGTSQSYSSTSSQFDTVDRWMMRSTGTGDVTLSQRTFTVGALSSTIPLLPKHYIRWDQTAYTSGTPRLVQRIEDVRTLAGETVSVSFYADCSTSTTMRVRFVQDFGTGGSPSSDVTVTDQTINLTTSWQKFELSFDIPSISGKTLGTNEDSFLSFELLTPQSAVRTDIAQVKVEVGNTVTPFEPRYLAEEVALCQRYYCQTYRDGDTPGTATANGAITDQTSESVTNSIQSLNWQFPVRMRDIPTVVGYSTLTGTASRAWSSVDGDLTVSSYGLSQGGVLFTTLSAAAPTPAVLGGTVWRIHYTADAEL